MKDTAIKYLKSRFYKLAVTIVMLAVFAHSCEKINDSMNYKQYKPDCKSGNCVNANIKGSLMLKPAGTGLRNVQVDVLFRSHTAGWFDRPLRVASGRTNKNGEFDFRATINTKSFEDHTLFVSVPKLNNYISVPLESGDNIIQSFHNYNSSDLKNISFVFYEKTMMTINLNRTQTDDFDYFSLSYSYENSSSHSLLIMSSSQFATDIVRQTNVPAKTLLNIRWQKNIGGERHVFRDSLICLPNINNVFNINY